MRAVRDWPVQVSMPMDGGAIVEVEILFHLKRPRPADMTALFMQPPVEILSAGVDAARKWKAAQFLPFVLGWGGDIVDENDEPLTFTPERFEALLMGADGVAFESGLFRALVDILNARAPAKNSSPLLSTSPVPAAAELDAPSGSSATT